GRGPHILPLDHLGEADDRVQGGAQLVDQLAQRIGRKLGAEQPGWPGQIISDLVDPRPPRAPAIAEEAAALRIEMGNAGDPPVARRRAAAGDVEARVAERGALFKRPRRLAVDAVMAAPGNRGDALPDQRRTRRAFDPDEDAVGAGFPAKAL